MKFDPEQESTVLLRSWLRFRGFPDAASASTHSEMVRRAHILGDAKFKLFSDFDTRDASDAFLEAYVREYGLTPPPPHGNRVGLEKMAEPLRRAVRGSKAARDMRPVTEGLFARLAREVRIRHLTSAFSLRLERCTGVNTLPSKRGRGGRGAEIEKVPMSTRQRTLKLVGAFFGAELLPLRLRTALAMGGMTVVNLLTVNKPRERAAGTVLMRALVDNSNSVVPVTAIDLLNAVAAYQGWTEVHDALDILNTSK